MNSRVEYFKEIYKEEDKENVDHKEPQNMRNQTTMNVKK